MKLEKLIERNGELSALFRSVEEYGLESCSCEHLRPKEVLLYSRSQVDCVYYLVNGEMWAFNEFLNGRRYSTERILSKSFIGEMEVVAEYPTYISTVTAVSLSIYVRIPLEVYRYWFANYPVFAQKAARRLASSLCRNATVIGVNNMLTADEAVSMLLYNLYCERQRENGLVVISETRQELAEHAGVSLRSVNRSISRLAEEGYISLRKGKVLITYKSHDLLLEKVSDHQILK